jgi:uncharacterized membrane protein YhaH (DUF805 family)
MSYGQTFFGFKGRLARLPFLGCAIILYALSQFAYLAAVFTLLIRGAWLVFGGAMLLAAGVVSTWVILALIAKRLHDIGLRGVHAIWIVPLIAAGPIAENGIGSPVFRLLDFVLLLTPLGIGLWLILAPGQRRENEYGPPPGVAKATANVL